MLFLAQFKTYLLWSLEFPFAREFVVPTIVLAGNLLLALVFTWKSIKSLWRSYHWLIFSNVLLFFLIVFAGVTFQISPGRNRSAGSNPVGDVVLDALLVLSLLIAGYFIYKMRGLRWLALSIALVEEWFVFGALFVAGMAVSGDWI